MDRLPCGIYFENYKQDMAVVQTRARWTLTILFLMLLFCVPFFASERILSIMNNMAIVLIAVHGLNILTGACGQISLGQSAFMAVGAYTSAFLVGEWGTPFWIGLICGGLFAGIIGLFFGLPSLRVKGFYLILVTLAAQFILVGFLPYQLVDITGGAVGLDAPDPELLGLTIGTEKSFYFLIVGLAVLLSFAVKNLLRTRIGRAFIAIQDNDLAASVMGISLYRYKLLAFFLGCMYAGIAGALFAHYTGHVDAGFFTLDDSIFYLGIIIVGGLSSTAGAVMGTVFLCLLNELTMEMAPLIGEAIPLFSRSALESMSLIIPGLIIILFLVFEPRGLYHRWLIIKAYFQFWPYAH